MNVTQTKPRKRRRWLILAVLLFIGSAVTWWYWPRGDARFVGKWELVRPGAPNIKEIWHLSCYGRSEHRLNGKVISQWKWATVGENVRLEEIGPYKGVLATSGLQEVQQEFARLIDRLLGRSVPPHVRSYRIYDATPEAVTLQRHSESEGRSFAPLKLVRIPE